MNMMPVDMPLPSLWRNRDFVRLWIAKTVSGI